MKKELLNHLKDLYLLIDKIPESDLKAYSMRPARTKTNKDPIDRLRKAREDKETERRMIADKKEKEFIAPTPAEAAVFQERIDKVLRGE